MNCPKLPIPQRRFKVAGFASLFVAISLGGFPAFAVTNTATTFSDTANDLSVGANYTPNITVTTATTSDIELTGAYTSGTTFTINGAALGFGTLDDLDTTQALFITNSNSTAGSITLKSPANSVSGAPGDLLYVASGASLGIGSGFGALTLDIGASGNIDTAGTLNITAPVSIAAGTTGTFTGGGFTTISGNIGTSTGGVNIAAGTVTFSGVNTYTGGTTISGGKLIILGTQTAATGGMILTSGTLDDRSMVAFAPDTVNISGGTILNGFGVQLASPAAANTAPFTFSGSGFTLGAATDIGGFGNINFGAGAVTISASQTINISGTGATFTFGGTNTNNSNTAETIAVNGAGDTLSLGAFVLNSGASAVTDIFGGTGNIALTGVVSNGGAGPNGLTYNGSGILTLSGANTYSGASNINGGKVVISAANNLGTGAGGLTFNGGILDSTANSYTLSENITLNGAGAIEDDSGTLTGSGTVALGTNTLLVTGVGNTTLSGVISSTSSAGGITKTGPGTLTLSGAAVNTYTGATTVNGGTLLENFANLSSATNLINSSSALVLGGGLFEVEQKSATTTSQTLNGVTVTGGNSAITGTNVSTGTLTVSLGTVARGAGSTGLLNFTLPASGSITVGNGNGPLGNWATVGSGTSFAYANVSSGAIAALVGTSAATFANVSDNTGAFNYDLSTSDTGTSVAGASVNSIQSFAGTGATSAINAGGITVNSLLNAGTGTWTISGGKLTIGANKELVIEGNSAATTISAVIADNAGGSSGLTYGGASPGILTLSTSNTFSGAVTINAGTLEFTNGGLGNGAATNTITLGAGALLDAIATGTTGANQTITLNGAAAIQDGSGTWTENGAIANGGFLLTGTGSGNLTLNGGISGAGGLTNYNSGATLGGINTYTGLTTETGGKMIITGNDTAATGGFTMSGGTLDIRSATAFGSGGLITISGGTIMNGSGAAVTETNVAPITIGAGNFTLGATSNSSNINFGNGPVNFTAGITISLAGTGAVFTFGGTAANATTTGVTTVVNNASSSSGNTLVFGGNYFIGGNSGNSSSTFEGTGNITFLGSVDGYASTLAQSFTYLGSGLVTMAGQNDYTASTLLETGTLALDFSQSANPTTAVNISGTGSAMANDGTMIIKGASGGTNSQSFPSYYLEGGNGDALIVNQNGATSLNVTLGALHRSLNSTLSITPPTAGTVSTNGALAASATGVVDFAAANGGSTWATINTTTGAFGALSSYSTGTGNYLAGNDIDVADGDTVSGVAVDSLRFNSAGETLNLSGANTDATGILVTSNATGTTLVTGGSLTSSNAQNELTLLNYGGTLNIASNIVDNGSPTSVTIGGPGNTILSGANTYTGLTTLTSGTLSLNGNNLSIAALAGGVSATIALGATNTLTVTTGAYNAVYSGAITGGTASGIVKNGTGALYLNNYAALTGTYAGTITDASGWLDVNSTLGATGLAGNTLVLGGGASTAATLYLFGSNNDNITVNGAGSPAALTLVGTSFVDSGVTSITTMINDPTFTVSTFGYDWLGRTVTSGQLSLKGGLTGTGNMLVNSGPGNSPQFYNDAINNVGTVTIMSPGTGTGLGAAGGGFNLGNAGSNAGLGSNVTAFVQATDGGSVTDYMPENPSGFVGSLYVTAGEFSDDTSQNNAGTSNISGATGLLNTGVSLVMGGSGIFQFKGTNTGSFKTQDQVLSSLTINPGSSAIDVDNPGGASNSATLDLRGTGGTTLVTRNVGGTVNFTASVGTFASTSIVKIHNSNDAGGLLGGWATVAGAGWATNNGSDTVTALGTYGSLGSASSTTNVDYGSTASQSSSGLAANTIRFNNAEAATLTLSGINVLTDGGLLVTSVVGANTTTITGGTLEGASGADLIVNQFDGGGALTIASTIADNTSATALTKSGTGTLTLTNSANTYSGATFLNAGILNVASLAAQGADSSLGTGASGYLVLDGGDLQYTGAAAATLSQGFTLTTAGGVFDASGSGSGSLTISGPMTITGGQVSVSGVATNVGGAQVLVLTGSGTGTAGGTFSAAIANGTQGVDYTALDKTGPGTWTLSGSNSYTGFTTLVGGTLIAANVSALGNQNGTNVVNPALVVLDSGTLQLNTDTSMNAYNFQEIASSTLVLNRAENGAAVNETLGSFNGDNTLTVNAGSNVTSGTPTLSFGNVSVANGNLAFIANSAEISLGNVNGTAGDASLYTLTLENNTTAASGTSTVTGSISDGPLGGILNLTRSTGNGTWVLSGVNSYSGVTSVQNGSLEIENNSALGDGLGSSSSAVNVSNGAVLQMLGGITTTTAIPLSLNGTGISGATFGALESVSGNNTYTGLVSIAGSSILIGSDTAGNTLTLSNSGTIIDTANSAGLLTFTGSGNIVVDSVIGLGAGAVGKSGAGTAYLEGASTYTGVTTISAGTLSTNLVANGGSASGIGAGSSAAAELVINGGTFQYTGAGASTNRNFTIGTSNATIDASGAGALVMTGTAAYSSVNNLETLTFTGTSAAVNTYAGALADNGTKMLNVTKAGSGVWNLSGVSTYSGTTSVTGGTLLVSGSLSGSGPVTVTNSTLGGSGYINGPASGLSIGSGGVLAPGALSGSAGTVLTVGNSVYLNGGSTLEINIDATTNATDLLYLSSGSLELSGDDTLTINILNGTQLTASNYVLAYLNNIGGNILGTFANVNIPTGYSVDYGDENGAELQLIAIPEPETWAILVCGMGMLVCLQRIKRRTRGSSFRIG